MQPAPVLCERVDVSATGYLHDAATASLSPERGHSTAITWPKLSCLSSGQASWHSHLMQALVSETHFSSIPTNTALTRRKSVSSPGKTLTLAVRRFSSCQTERPIGVKGVTETHRWRVFQP